MSIGAFTDKNREPTKAEVTDSLGATLQLWQASVQHIRATYRGREDFRFCYGKQYGWALVFRVKGSLLTALYPARNSFTVQVILNGAALEKAQALKLGNGVRQAMTRAKPYLEGKWLFVPVQSERDLGDVQQLLSLKTAVVSRKNRVRPCNDSLSCSGSEQQR